MNTDPHDDDRSPLLDRRRALTLLSGAGVAALVGCGSSGKSTAASASSSTGSSSAIPEETAGPFPGDGSNGPNVLTQNGIVRRDITSSFGSSSTKTGGVPTTVELTITNAANGTPYAGAAVYAWHCDQNGLYSLYSPGATGENYLRGVQAAGADGKVTFTSIFPAAYPGRWPHIHFEVYPTLAEATSAGRTIATSQLALPADTCSAVYATSGYEQSVRNMTSISLATDSVFSDGAGQETPTATGDVNSGITLRLTVPV